MENTDVCEIGLQHVKPSTHSRDGGAGCLSDAYCGLCNISRLCHKGTIIRSCRADNLRHDERRRNLPHYLPICLPKPGSALGSLGRSAIGMWGAPALLRFSLGCSYWPLWAPAV